MDPTTEHATSFWTLYGRPRIDGLPKYAQLRESLHAAILAGHWPPGSRMPTEDELCRVTRFSLGTVQRSLRALADDGILVRNQGSGTFVAQRIAPIDAPLHLRFLGRNGEPAILPLYSNVLSRAPASARGRWNELLGETATDILRIERRLDVNGEFNVYSRMYFRAATSPETATRPLKSLDGANLKQLIGGMANLPLRVAEQKISFVDFDVDAARVTGVRAGTRGLLLESAASVGRGTVVYFLESFIPPNRRKMDMAMLVGDPPGR